MPTFISNLISQCRELLDGGFVKAAYEPMAEILEFYHIRNEHLPAEAESLYLSLLCIDGIDSDLAAS